MDLNITLESNHQANATSWYSKSTIQKAMLSVIALGYAIIDNNK
jgi:hypothetical protein